MPIYRYRCPDCEYEFEIIHSWNAYAPTFCPECGEESLERMLGKPTFKLNGGGWYKDGYSSTPSDNSDKD